ncbi:MAG: hypothetical protein GY940_06045 [bacterium]|nr:hypothetical protein [bacterium]
MKKYLLLLCLVLVLNTGLLADEPKVISLPDLQKPDTISVDAAGGKLFISDQATVAIYSLKDFKLLGVFGKSGEGPREFKVQLAFGLGLRLWLMPDKILINSIGRVTFFSKDGDYINEYKIKSNVQDFKPIGNKYIGYGADTLDKAIFLTINLYDSEFQLEKEIYRKDWYAQTQKEFNPIYLASGMKRRALYHTYGGNVFIEGPKGEILVFDASGKQLHNILHDYGKVPLTEEHKKTIYMSFKKTPNLLQVVKKFGKFPAWFPLKYFTVADDTIYVLTFERKEGKNLFYLLDLKGKLIKKVSVPFAQQGLLFPHPYTIQNKTLYQLVDNEEEEEWQVHIREIR